jgi:hypothetical protein
MKIAKIDTVTEKDTSLSVEIDLQVNVAIQVLFLH